MTAVSYADVLIARYPGSEASRNARNVLGEWYHAAEQPQIAVREFQTAIAESPDSPEALHARSRLPGALFDAQRTDEAIQAWLDYGAAATDSNQKAWALLAAGETLSILQPKRRAEAVRLLQTVVRQYPESRSVAQAQARLSFIRGETLRSGPGDDPLNILNGNVDTPPVAPPVRKDRFPDEKMIDLLGM